MHISTKTEYAVRALSELAVSSSDGPVSIAQISTRQNLPRKYIEQLFRKLKRSDLVSSTHGAKGGYILKKPTNQISLKDIMNAVDENYLRDYCPDKPHTSHCLGLPCGFRLLWNEIKEHLETYFDSIKLDQIIAKL